MAVSRIIIGTRQSRLALWQAEYTAQRLREFYPTLDVQLHGFDTRGDRVLDQPLPLIGGKGVFTAELEQALQDGTIDLAVHSLKDLPTELDPAFVLAAIPERASPFDVLISRSHSHLTALPIGAAIGTSSLRRLAQLKAFRADLNVIPLRGNVPTRVAKAMTEEGAYDAIVLAAAGLDRLELAEQITEILDPAVMLPAPGQGALALQCRANDHSLITILAPLDHEVTRLAVTAERAFLAMLDAGCRLPVAALSQIIGTTIHLTGRVAGIDGQRMITITDEQAGLTEENAIALGNRLAEEALRQGAAELLKAQL
jgi:hydroxymethylbilane synthase